jgi:hypothetical protein
VLAELIAGRNLGRVVAYGDVEGCATALAELLDDDAERDRIRRNLRDVRQEYAWPRLVERLAALADVPGERVRAERSVALLTLRYAWLSLLSLALRRGLVATARESFAVLRRPRVP